MANNTNTSTQRFATNGKKFNTSVSPLWSTKSGGFKSLKIGAEQFDALQQIKIGGRLIVRTLDEASRKNEKSPVAYLDYITPEDVAEFEARSNKREETL